MKVKTLKQFRDLKEDKMRQVGDEFIVNKERFKEIQEKLKEVEDTDWIEEVK